MPEEEVPHKRRVRYKGTHPRRFEEKYKEHQPEKYAEQIEKLIEQGQTPAGSHRPICVPEILEILHPSPGETGLDATLGFGGHALELLKHIQPGGRLFATDVDPIEMPKTVERLGRQGFGPDSLLPRPMNFAGVMKLLPETGGRGFDFILADLGVSSMQLDNPQRGFTFKDHGPLDMRLNPERGKPVSEMLREWTLSDLEKILVRNADEPFADILAEAIFRQREKIRSTTTLARIVRETVATKVAKDTKLVTEKSLQRVFQAFRIAVNGEFNVLEQFLQALPYVMAPGGRAVILTFHSGEDNRVANSFAEGVKAELFEETNEEPVRPSPEERYSNPRSKCARLRWAVRK